MNSLTMKIKLPGVKLLVNQTSVIFEKSFPKKKVIETLRNELVSSISRVLVNSGIYGSQIKINALGDTLEISLAFNTKVDFHQLPSKAIKKEIEFLVSGSRVNLGGIKAGISSFLKHYDPSLVLARMKVELGGTLIGTEI